MKKSETDREDLSDQKVREIWKKKVMLKGPGVKESK